MPKSLRLTVQQCYALTQLVSAAGVHPAGVNGTALNLHGRTRRALRSKGILDFDMDRGQYVLTDLGYECAAQCMTY